MLNLWKIELHRYNHLWNVTFSLHNLTSRLKGLTPIIKAAATIFFSKIIKKILLFARIVISQPFAPFWKIIPRVKPWVIELVFPLKWRCACDHNHSNKRYWEIPSLLSFYVFYSNFAECHDSGSFEDSSRRSKLFNVKNAKVVYSELNFEIATTIVSRHVTKTEETNIATVIGYQKGEPSSSEIFKANKFSIDIFVFKIEHK